MKDDKEIGAGASGQPVKAVPPPLPVAPSLPAARKLVQEPAEAGPPHYRGGSREGEYFQTRRGQREAPFQEAGEGGIIWQ
jgi:hypothetical protein